MIKRKSIFRSIHCLLLVWVVGFAFLGCEDDWSKDGEFNSGQNVSINLKLPMSVADSPDPEKQIDDAHFFAFDTEGKVLSYKKITSAGNQQITVPIGRCDIYIIANYVGNDIGANTTRKDLEEKHIAAVTVIGQPFVMLGVYKGVMINKNAQILYGGGDISDKITLRRIAAKVTLNIEYTPNPSEFPLVIDSVYIGNKPLASWVIPGKEYAGSASQFTKTLHKVAMDANVLTYTFYLPEYIVKEANKTKSTYASIIAHVGDAGKTRKEFKIYIGDWFGYSKKYHEWDWAANPNNPSEVTVKGGTQKIGLAGLHVTRNTHYIFNGTLNGSGVASGPLTLDGAVEVQNWQLTDIPTDILPTAALFLSETDIIVNAIKDAVSISYETTLDDIKVEIDKTENEKEGFPRFTASVDKTNRSISFVQDTRSTTYTENNQPITVSATITASSGTEYILKKKITLVAHNPIAVSDLTGEIMWPAAMGYSNNAGYPYDYNNLKTKMAYEMYMNGAPGYIDSGCRTYFEGTTEDPQTGVKYWRLPTGSEIARMYAITTALGNKDHTYNKLQVNKNYWTSDETVSGVNATEAKSYQIYSSAQALVSRNKLMEFRVRCVLDKLPQYNLNPEKASYLSVSHDYYEVALGEYPGTLLSTVPITYQSDRDVDIRLYDHVGNDLSSMSPTERIDPYFLGFNVGAAADLQGNKNDLWFPKKVAVLQKASNSYSIASTTTISGASIKKAGKFYLFPNTQPVAKIQNLLSPYSFLPPQVNRMLYSTNGHKEFNLVFTAKNLSKSVRIRVINPVAENDVTNKTIAFCPSIGVDERFYVGYDISRKKKYPEEITSSGQIAKTKDMLTTIDAVLVSDTETGCASYFEGSPSDPLTGKGNWFLTPTFPETLVLYLTDRIAINGYPASSLKGETTEGDPKTGTYVTAISRDYWKKYVGIDNFTEWKNNTTYWSTKDQDQQAYGYRPNLTVPDGVYSKGGTGFGFSSAPLFARCTRRINCDALIVSESTVKIGPGDIVTPTYYTSSPYGVGYDLFFYRDVSNLSVSHIPDGNHTGGKVLILGRPSLGTGKTSIVNILLYTKNPDVNQRSYRIIKVMGK